MHSKASVVMKNRKLYEDSKQYKTIMNDKTYMKEVTEEMDQNMLL